MSTPAHLVPRTENPRAFPETGLGTASAGVANLYDAVLDNYLAQAVRAAFVPRFDPDPGYNPNDDPRLKHEQWALPHLTDSLSAGETAARLENLKDNRRRKADLEMRGASWSYFAAELFDPLNFVPLMKLGGIGLRAGAMAGARGVGGISVAQEGLRLATDPLYEPEQALMGVGAGTMFGALLGGALGRWGSRVASLDKVAGIEARARLDDVREKINDAPSVYDVGHRHRIGPDGGKIRERDTLTGGWKLRDEPGRTQLSDDVVFRVKGKEGEPDRFTRNFDEALEINNEGRVIAQAPEAYRAADAGTPGAEQIDYNFMAELDAKAEAEGVGPAGRSYASKMDDEELRDMLGLRSGGELHEDLIKSAEARGARLARGADEAAEEAAALRAKAAKLDEGMPADKADRLRRAEDKDLAIQEAKRLEDLSAQLRKDANELHEASVTERLALDEARRVGGDSQASVIKPGAGLSKLHWSQLPYFLLKNNRLGAVSEELAHQVRLVADELTSTPGLRMKGGVAGEAAKPSVESTVWQWHAVFEKGSEATQAAYIRYLGIEEPRNTARQMLLIRAKQELVDRPMRAARARLPGGQSLPQPQKMTFRQFREDIGKALIQGDNVPKWMPEDAKQFAQEAVAVWRGILTDMGQEMDQLGLLKTRATVGRQMKTNIERIGRQEAAIVEHRSFLDRVKAAINNDQTARDVLAREYERSFIGGTKRTLSKEDAFLLREVPGYAKDLPEPEAIKAPEWRQLRRWAEARTRLERAKMQTAIAERVQLEIETAQLQRYLEDSSGREAFHFPRVWRPDMVAAREDEMRDMITRHFKKNPFISRVVWNDESKSYVLAKVGTDPDTLSDRVEQTVAHILRETNFPHTETVDIAEQLDNMMDAAANAEVDLAAFEKRIPKAEGIGSETIASVTRNKRLVDDDGKVLMGEARLESNGTWTIHINDDAIAARFASKSPEWWKENFNIASAEDLVKLVEEHERAHTRLFKRGASETAAEYEKRVNREALRQFTGEGPPRTEKLDQLRDRAEALRKKVKELEAQGPGTVRRATGQRALDVDSRDFIEFMETDVEMVMSQYIQKTAPMIEMARRFGDSAMSETLGRLKGDMDEAIFRAEAESGRKMPEMFAERDAALQAVRDLRDKVLGTYGMPENPDAWHIRTVQFARSFNVLALMGKAWMAALVDAGAIVMSEGLTRTFRGLGSMWANFGRTDSGLALGKREAELAGLASEMTFATRLYAMTDLQGRHWQRTKLEQWTQDNAGKMFIVNGLAMWTDAAKRFAGAMISSRLIETSVKAAAGKATQGELEALSRAGISRQLATLITNEWKAAGGKVVDSMHIANTEAWRSPQLTRLFRGALAQETNIAIITPQAADKLNFMSKPLGALMFQYRSFSMAATWRISANALQQKDKQALAGVMSLVGLAMLVDKMKRPDWAEPSFAEAMYRAVELSGVGGIFTDMNSALEDASGHDLGLRATLGIGDSFKQTNWASRLGGVMGPATGQWANLAYAAFDDGATSNEQARAMRYMIPYNNLWIWNDMFLRVQRDTGEMLEESQ